MPARFIAFCLVLALCVCGCQRSSPPVPAPPGADSEFGSDPATTTFGGALDDYVYIARTRYPDGTVKIAKTEYRNDRGMHLHPTGRYVLYEYFRADGSKEKSKMVFPEAHLSASVITKYWVRLYAADGKTEVESRFYRADGTLGAWSDEVGNRYVQYRLDGKTRRYEQANNAAGQYVGTYFMKDGKTVWWEHNYDLHEVTVHFDLDGKPFKKSFQRKSEGYSMGANSPPVLHSVDSWKRADGTLEFRQSWYHYYDAGLDDFRDAVGKIEIFAADGKTKVKEVVLEPRLKRFIVSVTTYGADGSSTVRSYRSPNCRLREQDFDSAGKLLTERKFDAVDRFVEPLDEHLFQGFGLQTSDYDSDAGDR